MTNFDASVLFGCLAAIGMVFFMPRSAIFGLLIFVWAGGSIGLCIAYGLYYDASAVRMKLDESFPLFLTGMFMGAIPGVFMTILYTENQRARRWIEVSAVSLLFACAGAVLGCLRSDRIEGVTYSKVLQSAAVGAIIGCCLGYFQWALNRKKSPDVVQEEQEKIETSQVANS